MVWGNCLDIAPDLQCIDVVPVVSSVLDWIKTEWILFMLSCLGMGISLLRKGLWDYYTTPSLKTYFITSLITTLVVGIFFGVAKYKSYEVFREDIFGMLLPTVLIFSACLFVLVFVAIFSVGQLTIRRRKRLEEKYKDEKEE